MKSELELTVVYNNDKSIRCIYLDDHRIYGGKPYVSEGLRHDHLKVKTADVTEIAGRNAAPYEEKPAVDKPTADAYEFCPHCRGRFSFAKHKNGICPFCQKPIVDAPKPAAPADLLAELDDVRKELAKNPARTITHDFMCGIFEKLISKYRPVKAQPVEPLVVLADRVGIFNLSYDYEYTNPRNENEKIYCITMRDKVYGSKYFRAPTYAACEDKARAWLEAQDDKGGK